MLNIFSELFFIDAPDLDGQELYRERHRSAIKQDLNSSDDHVDTDCMRPGAKSFLGTECERNIQNSHRVAKSGK